MVEDNNLVKASSDIALFCRQILNNQTDLPVRSSEMGLMILIHEIEEDVTAKHASRFLKVSKVMVAKTVKSLVQKRLISKKQNVNDKRSYILKLTPEGEALVNTAIDDYISLMKKMKQLMGDQNFDELITLIREANQLMEEL